MDKEVLTDADIITLANASKKVMQGEMIIATLTTDITSRTSGEPRITKELTQEKRIPLKSTIIGEGITGVAVIDAFKKGDEVSKRKCHFSLQRSFFQCLEKFKTIVNNSKLNSGKIIYSYDDFGRVYILADGKKLYLNKSRTKVITEDGQFADIKIYEDSVELLYYYNEDAIYNPDFVNFDYLYISVEAAKRGERLINAEEERINRGFIADLQNMPEDLQLPMVKGPDNVIDLEEYRRAIEEGPKR